MFGMNFSIEFLIRTGITMLGNTSEWNLMPTRSVNLLQ